MRVVKGATHSVCATSTISPHLEVHERARHDRGHDHDDDRQRACRDDEGRRTTNREAPRRPARVTEESAPSNPPQTHARARARATRRGTSRFDRRRERGGGSSSSHHRPRAAHAPMRIEPSGSRRMPQRTEVGQSGPPSRIATLGRKGASERAAAYYVTRPRDILPVPTKQRDEHRPTLGRERPSRTALHLHYTLQYTLQCT